MPQGDRTGPAGAGPGTGRGLGYCGGNEGPGYANAGFGGAGPGRGRGRGRGPGRGFGLRHRFWATGPAGRGYPDYVPPTREETLSDLKAGADRLKEQLEAVSKRIAELEE